MQRKRKRRLRVEPVIFVETPTEYRLLVERMDERPYYHELNVSYFNKKGERVADFFFTVDPETREPRVLCSTGGNGEDHTLALFPMRAKEKSVEEA